MTDLREEVVTVADSTRDAVAGAAILAPTEKRIEGVKFQPFTAGRKILLSITQNEFYNAREHVEKFMDDTAAFTAWWTRYHATTLADFDTRLTKLAKSNLPAAEVDKQHAELCAQRAAFAARPQPAAFAELDNADFCAACEQCVPEFELHVGALSFICCTDDVDLLADLSADKKQFRRAVLKWLMQFTTARLQNIHKESLRRYADETIGADFEVVTNESAEPENPN